MAASVDESERTRRHDNDWLTVSAMVGVFLFHCARFFNDEGWHVKNDQLSAGLSLFVAFVSQWLMSLFFVLSGMSARYSLAGRSSFSYLVNRFRRLAVPLAFGSLVVIAPVQVWVERVTQGRFQGSFWAFYPHYFDGMYAFGGNFAWTGLHLWYLEMLFLFSLITLPAFARLSRSGQAASRPWPVVAAFLPVAPLWAVEVLVNLRPDGIGMRAFGGWSPATYLVLFCLGFFFAAGPGRRVTLERARWSALAAALAASLLMFVIRPDVSVLGDAPAYLLRMLVRSLNCWSWLAAALGFAGRHLDHDGPVLRHAREAVLPFYILHQTFIVVWGYALAHWRVPVSVKYVVLATLSLSCILATYLLLVRPWNAVRVLFGLGPRKSRR